MIRSFLLRSILALFIALSLSGCMVMMAPMLLMHAAHLKKKHTVAPLTESCDCCLPDRHADVRNNTMGSGHKLQQEHPKP
jgi:hypothetical protein